MITGTDAAQMSSENPAEDGSLPLARLAQIDVATAQM